MSVFQTVSSSWLCEVEVDLHCSINRSSIVRRSVSDAVQQNIFKKKIVSFV